MRNTMTVLLLGSILAGCLGSERQSGDLLQDQTVDQSGNNPPTISGNPPPATTINDLYEFQPTATDADGDALTFSVDNKPNWASFDSATGRLAGEATLGDIGVYQGIVITVSDGNASAALAAFSIEVSQTALGSVSLSWVAPNENEDGSALQDLAGFNIYYGKQSGEYDRQIQINNPSVSTFVVDQLTQNSYYFAATAFNTAGVESSLSAEVMRVVN